MKCLGPVWPTLLIGVLIAGACAALFSLGKRKRWRSGITMKHATPIMAIFVLVVALLGGYVGAYVLLGTFELVVDGDNDEPYAYQRTYTHEWLPPIFKPAADVEGFLRDMPTSVAYRSPDFGFFMGGER